MAMGITFRTFSGAKTKPKQKGTQQLCYKHVPRWKAFLSHFVRRERDAGAFSLQMERTKPEKKCRN